MAKLLLCCDEYIYSYNGNYYFKNQEMRDFFHRYLRVFESIRLVTRCKEEKVINKNRVILDSNKIEYWPLPFFQGPRQYTFKYIQIGKALKNSIKGCDCALLRLPSTIAERLGKLIIEEKLPYALEIVFDAEDGWKNSSNLINKLLWKKIDHNMKILSSNADGISCVTEFYLQKHYYSKKQNSFTAHYSSLSLDKSFFKSERDFPENKSFTIVNIANQITSNGRKGHVEIIRAIAVLKKEGVIVNVKFVGSDYNDGIRKLIKLSESLGVQNQVSFLGYMEKTEISKVLNNADLYVMPTKSEGLPRVIIEAMAKGLPCLTTNISGNSELIEKKFLVDDYYDINSWALKIKELITNAHLYESASKYNYNNSLNYEAEILQLRRDEFYKKLKKQIVSNR